MKQSQTMQRNLEDLRNEWIDHIGERAEKFGFARIAGQLEGLLFLTSGPMSLDEMADRLEVSKASISTNIRFLERLKVVRKVYHRGERKNFYEIAGDIWEIETEILKTLIKDELERFQKIVGRDDAFLADYQVADGEDASELELIRDRVAAIREYLEAGEHLLGMLLKKGAITPAVVRQIEIK